MRSALLCFLALVLLLSACGKENGPRSKQAVQEAIETYLKQRPNLMLANMTFEIEDVRFSGENAEAQVKFRSKQSPDLVVSVRYALRRAGNHWQVESSSPTSGMGASPHGGTGTPMPAPAPAAPTPQSSH